MVSERKAYGGVTLAEQIAELKREHAIRQRVYPGWVHVGRMTQEEADRHQSRLSAAISTLEFIERHYDTVKALLEGR